MFAVVLVAIHRRHRCWIARVLEFVIVHHPLPLPLPGSDEVCKLFDLLLPPHVVPAAPPPSGHVCNVIIRRARVILASSASPTAACATAALMLREHLPPQVAMTPTMLSEIAGCAACAPMREVLQPCAIFGWHSHNHPEAHRLPQ